MNPSFRLLLPCLLTWSVTGASQAEETVPAREWFGSSPWLDWSALSGDWDGARTALAGHGVTVLATVTDEGSLVVDDGVPVGSPAPRAGQRILVNAGMAVDLNALAGVPGALLSATYQYAGGDPASARTGDVQGWSNISVDADINQLSECWYQQRFGTCPGGAGDLVRVKLGKIDGNVDFDALPAQGNFFSSAAAYSLCFAAMPTYPNPATGVTAFVQPVAGLTLGAACFDAATVSEAAPTGRSGARGFFAHGLREDKLWVGQIGADWTPSGTISSGDLAFFGVYAVDGDSAAAVPGSPGWFAGAEQDLWSGAEGRALTASVRAAGTSSRTGRLDRHLAAGLWCKGTFPGRAADGVGLFISDVRFSATAAADPATTAAHETEYEAAYALPVAGWWLLRLDLQYIRHPGGSSAPDHALVVALRSDLTL